MSDEMTTHRASEATVDRAAEEYLRDLADGKTPDIAELVRKYGTSAAELQEFARDYQQVAAMVAPQSLAGPNVRPTIVKQFGDYELEEEPLGQGGMGVVYKARQRSLDRTVAVKLILAGKLATTAEKSRFLREARLAARLQHPNIVAIHEVGQIEGQHYFSMDFLEGPTLDRLVEESGSLSSATAAAYVRTAAEAVHYAHELDVIHRDLKPSNVIMDAAGVPHVTDFGLAKELYGDPDATQTFGFVGTPAYSSPEQISAGSAAADRRTDVYGLGAILYKLLTMQAPFHGASAGDVCRMVISEEPRHPRSLNAHVDVDLATVCMKCLAKEPGRRYPTARELANDLGRFLRDEPIRARPPSAAERGWRWCRRNRGWAAAIGAASLAILVVVAGGFLVSNIAAVSRGRASLLEIRVVNRSDGWSERAWQLVGAASRVGQDPTVQSQAALTLAGIDARKLRAFPFGADHVAFSEDGKSLAMAAISNDHSPKRNVAIWNIDQNGVANIPRNDSAPVAFVDGTVKQLAIASNGLSLALVSVQDGGQQQRFVTPKGWSIWPSMTPVIASNGGTVACLVTGPDQQINLAAWDARSGELIGSVPCGAVDDAARLPTAIRPSDDGTRIAIGRVDGRILVIDPDLSQPIADLGDRQHPILGLAVAPNCLRSRQGVGGTAVPRWLVASADAAGRVIIWGVETETPLAYCRGSHHTVHAVDFSPDGMTLASGGRGASKLWDVATGQLLLDISANDNVASIDFSPDGRQLAIATQTMFSRGDVSVWEIVPDRGIRELRGLEAEVSKLCFSSNGRLLAALAHDWRIALWDVPSCRLLHVFEAPPGLLADNAALAFDPDSSRLAYSSGENAVLWDASNGALLKAWKLPRELCDVLLFSSADELYSFRADRERWTCRIRNLLASTPLDTLGEITDFSAGVLSAAAIPNRQWFIAEGFGGQTGSERSVRIYDTTGKAVHRIATQSNDRSAWIALDPAGEHVALRTRGSSSNPMLYAVATGHALGPLVAPAVCISTRAKYFAIRGTEAHPNAGYTIYADAAPVVSVDAESPHTSVAAFDASGGAFAWGRRNGTVRVCFLDEVRERLSSVGLGW